MIKGIIKCSNIIISNYYINITNAIMNNVSIFNGK